MDDPTSLLSGDNAGYLEALQDELRGNPEGGDAVWRSFFGSFSDRAEGVRGVSGKATWLHAGKPSGRSEDLTSALTGEWVPPALPAQDRAGSNASAEEHSTDDLVRITAGAVALIQAVRTWGHLGANLDPLARDVPAPRPELAPATYGLSDGDLDATVALDGACRERRTIRGHLDHLRSLYCSTIGYEYMHIADADRREWLRERIEGPADVLDAAIRRTILDKLIEAKGFERFLDRKFVGTKRFGLDGAEATIPALEAIIASSAHLGVEEVAIGMAHRGRLNVLAQVLCKPHRAMFAEFRGASAIPEEVDGSGDVKYHLGASADRHFDGRPVHLSLSANPSHLEIVDPVVLGRVRAKQDQRGDRSGRSTVLALLIHGDAAFAGQGVVAEILGLSGLEGYRTGGSVHFIINNQIGFTTDPRSSRSSTYASDLAKMIDAPILHVNGDDPDAVVRVARLASEFRHRFGRPVVIDMLCYRYYGHNEGDEPSFTQPLMYQAIRSHASVLELYAGRLVDEGLVSKSDLERAQAVWAARLEDEFAAAQGYSAEKGDWLGGRWRHLRGMVGAEPGVEPDTGVALYDLHSIGRRISTLPEGFAAHPKIVRFLEQRRRGIEDQDRIDWSTAEALAFATLVDAGIGVRLSGQDSERGTFTQRHAVLYDQRTGDRYQPLEHVRDGQASCEIVNSMLSEEAVLGFEYGYTLAEPDTLVLWEAQFGDFANGAQVVFDQFIASGERKWLRMSGLVCLLPHGYDGQGPEHSSARLERFLQNSAEYNWQVVNCTTPANYFHVLRRQIQRDFRKPLIVMTPKSLLRDRRVISGLGDLAVGTTFQPLLDDPAHVDDALDVSRIILCSGKVYFDLVDECAARDRRDVRIVRIEELYPFPRAQLSQCIDRSPGADVIWCQEEPMNMGAWSYVEPIVTSIISSASSRSSPLRYVGRPASASPAAGTSSRHEKEARSLLRDAFD